MSESLAVQRVEYVRGRVLNVVLKVAGAVLLF
jgi:hypothetical protein